MSSPGIVEEVVLVDDDGHAIGTAPKAHVHHAATPLHLAFSCYVFDAEHRLLLTQRAARKVTWPGVWTNSCCGHPVPGEHITDAVRRRTREELGLELSDLRLVLPRFRYQVWMADGTAENELCPIFVATTRDRVSPDPEEVDDHAWVDWQQFRTEVLDGSREVSPWCALQVEALPEAPYDVEAADPGDLPPAARLR